MRHSSATKQRRSPCGERGLKCRAARRCGTDYPSLPVRGAWIEINQAAGIAPQNGSLPVRGAWIEIVGISHERRNGAGRSPCGERGLKFSVATIVLFLLESLPVRGAWIEIWIPSRLRRTASSLPVRGAWIEILSGSRTSCRAMSLPVRGAWIEIRCARAKQQR